MRFFNRFFKFIAGEWFGVMPKWKLLDRMES